MPSLFNHQKLSVLAKKTLNDYESKRQLKCRTNSRDDFSDYVDDKVVKLHNENGNVIYIKPVELENVLQNMITKILEKELESNDYYKEVSQALKGHVTRVVDEMKTYTLNYFNEQLDILSEEIAEKMLDSEIERRVKEKLEIKIEEIKKLL